MLAIVLLSLLAVFIFLIFMGKNINILKASSPKDLWLLFIYSLIITFATFITNAVVASWLSNDCGMTDSGTGIFVTLFTTMVTIVLFFFGGLVDTIGVKKTLVVALAFLLFSRFFMVWVTIPAFAFGLGLFPFAFGVGVVGPVIAVAVKRLTTKETAAIGFALLYLLPTVAGVVSGVFNEMFFTRFKQFFILGHSSLSISSNQIVIAISFFVVLCAFIAVFFMKRDRYLNESWQLVDIPVVKVERSFVSIKNVLIAVFRLFKTVITERQFRIYLVIISLTVFMKSSFFHFFYTLPKYSFRLFGDSSKVDEVYSLFLAVSLVLFVPMIAYFTRRVATYKMLIIGSLISALSFFIAVIPASLFEPLTTSFLGEQVFTNWLHISTEIANTSEYWPLIFFLLFFSVGEAIWAPRMMQFLVEIAPRGKEGAYFTLSMIPFVVAKFLFGPLSGYFLTIYAPRDIALPDNHAMIWVWVGCIVLITPISLYFFAKPLLYKMKIESK